MGTAPRPFKAVKGSGEKENETGGTSEPLGNFTTDVDRGWSDGIEGLEGKVPIDGFRFDDPTFGKTALSPALLFEGFRLELGNYVKYRMKKFLKHTENSERWFRY